MAVDFLHRLIISGPVAQVGALGRALHREYPRTVGGETWTEVVPFSFAALYDLAPAARRIEREVPHDPYDLSVWPVRRLTPRRAELRYQFHTRNLEMADLIRAMSHALPTLTFTLATLCFDDSGVEGYRFTRGRVRRWCASQAEDERLWERARRKFGRKGDDVYEDDEATHWVEERAFDEALWRWDVSRRGRAPVRRRRQWWNQPALRDLGTERQLALAEIAAALEQSENRRTRKKKPAKPRR